ncbi:hypothetical protein Aci011_015 [Acinetobacter phage vB_AbaM_B09_Aci01-1]|uniref:Uncharacterized protein n=3 Tax=Saclayvirus TaxID=2733128 RepID=A0A386KNG6_9CAUD|nr:hypothetical protein HOU29_gp015 [Acinetobacter phage vB_AbaM_B09_Aci01-1]YP_009813238.1 hypothetical protein HOU30_gp016 [Acinetobacter phage vB_AbaM_B09_Aci02-2]YP_009813868.1 hypothetical protein HOU35_gp014 [Acinetobacter phage vB_AbaM_B09_Aci05]AZF88416.1 hypothetical protein TAC_0015 [Acinetobacter phage TAC1]QMP18986.1 hypothetical protein FKOIJHOC_00038 [Acinetobacter phage Ab_121]QQV88716.1 hypothetical protein Liucustia_16 [Acinetobacter phage Liucustia]UYL86165.1 hypothetical pr
MSSKKSKNSTEVEISEALANGGIIYVNNCRVFIDNPKNFSIFESPTGFWIKNAMDFMTYFKATTREKAQEACDELFGKGRYKVNSRV